MPKRLYYNEAAVIKSREVKDDLSYKKETVLNIEIVYPRIDLRYGQRIQRYINYVYESHVRQFYRYAKTIMYKNAVENYNFAKENDFPFHTHEAVMKYTVTQNADCRLSTYFDRYQYTGGAHGITVRFSDNFNLQTGEIIKLESLFAENQNYKEIVIEQIQKEAERNYNKSPYIYFPNYKELIVEKFNPESFNLSPGGILVYYQQYDIAPYSTGIVVFTLPYKSLGIEKPMCKR